MTRETKIGLLVGLAFIVVFAMLLSHSGPTSPPGDLKQFAKSKPNTVAPVITESPSADTTPSPIATNPELPGTVGEGSPATTKVDLPSPTESDSPDTLPSPSILNPGTPPGVEQAPTGVADATPRDTALEMRVAPTDVVDPHPIARDSAPVSSPPPVAAAAHADEHKADDTAEKSAGSPEKAVVSTEQPAGGKEYVAQKGDTLCKILKNEYGAAGNSAKVEELFLKTNKIKDKAMVRVGQKLLVPALPADMFEPVGGGNKVAINVGHKTGEVDLAKSDAAPVESSHKAPPETLKLADKPKDKDKHKEKSASTNKLASETKRASREIRVYEVQSKDTFSSIAKDQMGSSIYWQEIKRLNPSIDPARMRPGMKLNLPRKRPLPDAVVSGRS